MLDEKGKYDAAEMLYRRVLQVEPKHLDCYCTYGLLLDRHGISQLYLLYCYKKKLLLHKVQILTLTRMPGHQESAMHMFEAVLSLDDSHADTLCAYGDLLSRAKGDVAAAGFGACLACLALVRCCSCDAAS